MTRPVAPASAEAVAATFGVSVSTCYRIRAAIAAELAADERTAAQYARRFHANQARAGFHAVGASDAAPVPGVM